MNPDYACHTCGNQVLYRVDHKPDCVYYVAPLVWHDPRARLN